MIEATPQTAPRVSLLMRGRDGPRVRGECAGFLVLQAVLWLVASHAVAGFPLLGIPFGAPISLALGVGAFDVTVPLPSILALIGTIAIFTRRRVCWHFAMAAQSTALVACLYAWASGRPGIVFPVMLSCIVMALYLNSTDVRSDLEGSRPARRHHVLLHSVKRAIDDESIAAV